MYCVYEDTSNLESLDTSHATTRMRYLIASKVHDPAIYVNRYYSIGSYNKANTYAISYTSDTIAHTNNGYANAGGVYGSMDVSLVDNQIKFNAITDGAPYLGGRTYNYILYWGGLI